MSAEHFSPQPTDAANSPSAENSGPVILSSDMGDLLNNAPEHADYTSNKAQVLKTMFEAARSVELKSDRTQSARQEWEAMFAINKLVKDSLS